MSNADAAARARSPAAWVMLAVFVAVSFGAATPGALFPPGDWYRALAKPAWTPPDWLFAPVWTLLYLAMGVAAWLVWRRAGWRAGGAALVAFALQLVLNGTWSWLFFGLHRPGLAFAEILVLWLAIAVMVVLFWRVSTVAGAMMAVYLAWVGFAVALNGAIWRLGA